MVKMLTSSEIQSKIREVPALGSVISAAFDSMAQYKRIEDSRIEALRTLYVDPWSPNKNEFLVTILNSWLKQKHYLIVGRKGSGKTTIMQRAILECDDSLLNSSKIIVNKKVLGIFFNLKTNFVTISRDIERSNEEYILEILSKLIETVLDKLKTPQISKVFNLNEKDLEDKKKKLLKVLKEGKQDLGRWKAIVEYLKTIKKVQVSLEGIDFERIELKESLKFFDLNQVWIELMSYIHGIGIEYLYIFLDEFSELTFKKFDQKLIYDNIIGPIVESIELNCYFSICVYPNQYYIGSEDLGKHFLEINLSFNKLYNIPKFEERKSIAIEYIRRMIENRLKFYFSELNNDFLKSNNIPIEIFQNSFINQELYEMLLLSSMMVPRDLGIILSESRADLASVGYFKESSIKTKIKEHFQENLKKNYFNLNIEGKKKPVYKREDIIFDKELFNKICSYAKEQDLKNKGDNRFAFFSISDSDRSFFSRSLSM